MRSRPVSVPLSGVDKNNNAGNESTLLLFSDTFIGEVNDGKPLPGYTMVNNSIAYFRGNDPDPRSIRFYYRTSKDDKPVSIFVPKTSTAERPQHFWLVDGFVNKAGANVHVKMLYGRSNHHKIEAIFKCFARAMKYACSKDARLKDQLPSTKGLL